MSANVPDHEHDVTKLMSLCDDDHTNISLIKATTLQLAAFENILLPKSNLFSSCFYSVYKFYMLESFCLIFQRDLVNKF